MLQVSEILRGSLGTPAPCHLKCHQRTATSGWEHWQEQCLVDPQDADLVARHFWRLSKPGTRWRYAVTTIRGKRVPMHRMILGVLPGILIDHINGDTLDNRRANLRVISNAANIQNQHRSRGKSQFQGVAYQADRIKPWRAQIMRDYKRVNLGNYATEIEAAAAYDVAAVRMFGPGAKQNLQKEAA